MTSPHLVLAGDASHAIHPLAGQGYNLALGDAAVLADCLARASARGLSAGHRSVETDYLAGRKFEVTAMTAMTSGLNQLMSFQPAIAKVTGAGMGLVNAGPVKSFFQKSAMGGHLARANLLEGRLPT
jgi:2-octaprenyl-6-methoxyphenol hydroxylase